MLKQVLFQMARVSGINAVARGLTRGGFRIITYHGVDEQDHPLVNYDRLQIHPRLFQRQVESLARTYHVVSLRDALKGFLSGRGWPERGLAITFDDGYRNNVEVAAPILQRLGLPATVFITAGFVEGRARPWWYDLREAVAGMHGTELLLPGEPARDLRTVAARRACCQALEWAWVGQTEDERQRRLAQLLETAHCEPAPLRYPFMSRQQVIDLFLMGVEIEPHGDTHCSMLAESADRALAETRASAEFIRQVTTSEPVCMAWPYGHQPDPPATAEAALAAADVKVAVGVATGFNRADTPRYALRRWDLHGGYTVAAAQARLAGFTTILARPTP